MKHLLPVRMALCLTLICAFACSATCRSQQFGSDRSKLPQQLQGLGIDQRLNAPVPTNAVFLDDTGAPVTLARYLAKGPVLLLPVYYTCPMLCSQILHGVVAGLRPLRLRPGRDFQVVAFSFNPSETTADASNSRTTYMRLYSTKADPAGWHFLTGSPQSIAALTNAIGFHYKYDPQTRMFLHASGVMVLTPEGRISRYFYGVEYDPKDLELGLIDASHHTIGTPVEEILLFCCRYDPATGKYGADVVTLLRLAAGAMLVALVVGLSILWRRDTKRSREQSQKKIPARQS